MTRAGFAGLLVISVLAATNAAAGDQLNPYIEPYSDEFGAPMIIPSPNGYRPDDLARFDQRRLNGPYGRHAQENPRALPPTSIIPASVPPYKRQYYIQNKPKRFTRRWYEFCAERRPEFNAETGRYRTVDGKERWCH